MNKSAMYNLTYGLFVLTAKDGSKDNGCIVNTVTQVTTQPNRITVTVNKSNLTHDIIAKTGIFNVSILTEKAKFETFRHWGFQSGRDTDKTAGSVPVKRSENGLLYITDETNGYISAKVISSADLDTHTMFIAYVTGGETLGSDKSATYEYYQNNIKNAPAPAAEEKGFVCSVCGYVYHGDSLPEDFVCPICKHPASDFKPING